MACPFCGCNQFWPLAWTADPAVEGWRAAHHDTRDYAWQLCQRCGNGYPNFQPDLALLAFFWNRDRQDSSAGGKSDGARWDDRQRAARKLAKRSFDSFAALSADRPGRFLDIACGLGETVKYFADRGWDAVGIDADPTLRRFHERLGIQTQIAQIENAALEGTFDLIQIAHAIYFITNPRQILETLRSRLNRGGLLCVVLADFMASDDRSRPGYAHSFYPTASSMRYLLALAGFETIQSRTISGSVYIAARANSNVTPPLISPRWTWVGYRTKNLRYAVLGGPHLILRRVAKTVLGRHVRILTRT
jgi:SAM-dependent methyltransferase